MKQKLEGLKVGRPPFSTPSISRLYLLFSQPFVVERTESFRVPILIPNPQPALVPVSPLMMFLRACPDDENLWADLVAFLSGIVVTIAIAVFVTVGMIHSMIKCGREILFTSFYLCAAIMAFAAFGFAIEVHTVLAILSAAACVFILVMIRRKKSRIEFGAANLKVDGIHCWFFENSASSLCWYKRSERPCAKKQPMRMTSGNGRCYSHVVRSWNRSAMINGCLALRATAA